MPGTRPLRLVIADDDQDIREALCDVFAADARFEVVGCAGNGTDCLDVCQRQQPDVALLDVRMPFGGISAALLVRGLRPAPAVVVITAQDDVHMVAGMLRAGVVGILAKGRLGDELPDIVARCAAGEVVLATRSAAEGLAMALSKDPAGSAGCSPQS